MKKIYLTPAMEVINTKVASVICTSGDKLNINRNSMTTVKGADMEAKRRGIFQDDSAEDQSIW